MLQPIRPRFQTVSRRASAAQRFDGAEAASRRTLTDIYRRIDEDLTEL